MSDARYGGNGITRRQLLQSGAAAGGALAVGSQLPPGVRPMGKARAVDVGTFVVPPIAGPSAAVFGAAAELSSLVSEDDITVGDVSYHQTATSAYNAWTQAKTILQNAVEDLGAIMSINARKAIADAWESDQSEAEATQAAHDAIYERADTLYQNSYVAKQRNLLHLAYISKSARNESESSSNWENSFFSVIDSDYSGSGSLVDSETRIAPIGDATSVDLILPSGNEVSVESVEYKAGWDNGDSWSGLVTNNLLDSYDSTNEMFESIQTADGNSFDASFFSGVLSVPDHDLLDRTGAELMELAELLTDIEDKVSTLISNYGSSFVNDLYSALDEGSITPDQLRGVEALASWMSGSTDATESRYQLALSTIRDVPRPDLSEVSLIDMDLTGWKDAKQFAGSVTGPEDRETIPKDPLSEPIQRRGTVYADHVSANLTTGESYLVDPYIVHLEENGYLTVHNGSGGGGALYRMDDVGAITTAGYGGDFCYLGDGLIAHCDLNSQLTVADVVQGSVVSSGSQTQYQESVCRVDHDDGSVSVAVTDDNEIELLDAESGSSHWYQTSMDQTGGENALTQHGDMIVGHDRDQYVFAVRISDGSIVWETQVSNLADAGGVATSDSTIIVPADDGSNAGIKILDSGSGDVLSTSLFAEMNGVYGLCKLDNDTVAAVSGSNFHRIGTDGSLETEADLTGGSLSGPFSYISPLSKTSVMATAPTEGYAAVVHRDGTVMDFYDSGGASIVAPPVALPGPGQWDEPDSDQPREFHGSIHNASLAVTSSETDSFKEMSAFAGVAHITAMQDSDGEPVDTAETDTTDPTNDYGSPDYETLNNEEIAELLDQQAEELAGALDDAGSGGASVGGIFGPGGLLDFDGDLKKWAIIGGAGLLGYAFISGD